MGARGQRTDDPPGERARGRARCPERTDAVPAARVGPDYRKGHRWSELAAAEDRPREPDAGTLFRNSPSGAHAVLGSAPTQDATKKGLEDRQIKLGCVQPGETSGTFGDALRKLADQATYLYVDGSRYWYATQPSVNRLAEERAERYHPEDVAEEIRRRLLEEAKHRGDFSKVHSCPTSFNDVVDEPEAKLVILSPDYPHSAKTDSSAGQQAAEILNRGSAGRNCGNMLVFLAADKTRLVDLDKAVRSYMAWKSIEKEKVSLNLTPFQANQVEQKITSSDQAVKGRIPETYVWLLVAGQKRPETGQPFPAVEWQEFRLQGQEWLAERASKKLKNDGLLVTSMAGTRLRFEITQVPLWRGESRRREAVSG